MITKPAISFTIRCLIHTYMRERPDIYEVYSKINLRLAGKNKRVVIASKRTLSSNKELLFLLYAYPHTFSPRSVGVNTDRTWTLSTPLPPAVKCVLWFVFFTQKDKARQRFVYPSSSYLHSFQQNLVCISHNSYVSYMYCRSSSYRLHRSNIW